MLAPPLQLHLRSSGIRACSLDPLHVQFTAGFELLWGSNESSDQTGDGAPAVMQVMGSGYKYRWSFTCSPATHLLLCKLVPSRPQNSTSLWLRGWDPCCQMFPKHLLLHNLPKICQKFTTQLSDQHQTEKIKTYWYSYHPGFPEEEGFTNKSFISDRVIREEAGSWEEDISAIIMEALHI